MCKGEEHFSTDFECNEVTMHPNRHLETSDELSKQQVQQLQNVVVNDFDRLKDITISCTNIISHDIKINDGVTPIIGYNRVHFMQSKVNDELDVIIRCYRTQPRECC